MRFESLLLISLVGVCCAYAAEDRGDAVQLIRRDERRDPDKRNDNNERSGIKKRQLVRTKNEGDIYNPCDYEDDIDCIRHFFISTGQCKGVHNYGSKPVFRDQITAFIPSINLTGVFSKSRIQYTGDKIISFYINKASKNLVMAVNFDNIRVDHKVAQFRYHRTGQEPIMLSDFAGGDFGVTLTAVIPMKNGLQLKDAQVMTNIGSIAFDIGPNILTNTQPLVVKVNTALFTNIPTVLAQYYLTEGPSQFLGYLQQYICDFGLSISNFCLTSEN